MAEPIDAEVWASLVALEAAGEPGFLATLLKEFLASVPPRLRSLHAAEARGDARALEWVAHSLKGSCGTLGASGMLTLCGQLEQAGQAGTWDGQREALAALEAEWQKVREALEARLPRQPGEPSRRAGSRE